MDKIYIDKLAFIELKDRKILVTLSKGKDTWYIPGGKREAQESDQEALTREVKEELTIDLIPGSLVHVGTYEAQAHGKPEGTMVRMTCYGGSYIGNLEASSEIEKIDWFTFAQKMQTSVVDQIIFEDLKSKNLID